MVKSWSYVTQSFNINNACFYWSSSCQQWWLLYTPNRDDFWWASVLLPDNATYQKLSQYDEIQTYSNIIFNHPAFFQEKYKINIFNSLPTWALATNLTNDLLKYGFYIPKIKSIWNTWKIYTNSVVYYNGIDENSETLKVIAEMFPNIKFEKNNGVKYAKELDTKIEIIIWQDYKKTLFNNI
jgi:hypothetical protein